MTELLRELEEVVREIDQIAAVAATGLDRRLMDLTSKLRTHHAEIAEAVADARRYRHIKSAPAGTVRADFNAWLPSYYPWGNGTKSLDEQIDAALDAHNSAREVGE